MKTNYLKSLLPVMVLSMMVYVFQGCKDDDEKDEVPTDWDLEASKELDRVMHNLYYWADQVPSLNVANYKSPVELMNALMVTPPDKWSYVTTKKEFEDYNAGIFYGFGFGSVFDTDGNLWVGYTFKSSPFTQKGIRRGWRIAYVDGVVPTKDNFNQLIGESKIGITKTFGFVTPAGTAVSYTFSKIEVEMNMVLFDSVYTIGSKKIGYVVFNGFVAPAKVELDNTFAKFKSKGVNEIIVDFRYNGGGSIDVSCYLASLIGGNVADGSVYTTYKFNDKNSNRNQSVYFKSNPNAVTVSKALFITTYGTASASELVINGLKPYMPVVLIGSKTHGKPVGMPVLMYNEFDWVFLPISFSLRNANDEGDYFEGIAVNVVAADDCTSPFGDINEDSFAAALNYLGVLPKGVKSKSVKESTLFTGKGLYEEIGAW